MTTHYERIGKTISGQDADRMCLKKRQFDTRTAARDFAIRGEKLYQHVPMTPYRCAVCGMWHNSQLNNTDGNMARRRVMQRGVK